MNTIRQAQADDKASHAAILEKSPHQVAWDPPPPQGWVCVNTGGSVKQPGSIAAGGGVIWDWTGKCKGAFVVNLGRCTITRAEIMAAIRGLQIAWRAGFRKVHLQLDSMTTITILTSPGPNEASISQLDSKIQKTSTT
ncbi:unnamed protein product [Linum tenue]|uniref:RNase H type-1 domain-containing protein n=1 Tax=Linum tenue TaxID=586396 RepID=A0AAV0MCT5_9ROSI|nr:unnamed protein product [Linum tenue]